MVWREPQNHLNDCYFCIVKLSGTNAKKKHCITYPNLPSAMQPIPHCGQVPVPVFLEFPSNDGDEGEDEDYDQMDSDFDVTYLMLQSPAVTSKSNASSHFSQEELNDLVRYLSLSKENSELLASTWKEKYLLESGTNVTFYRTREKEFLPYFKEEDSFAYCHDVAGVLNELGVTSYEPGDWRLFIDSSKKALNALCFTMVTSMQQFL